MATLDLAGIITRVCTDLKLRFAAIIHNHSASDITSGTLAESRGGTGKSSFGAALDSECYTRALNEVGDYGAMWLDDDDIVHVGGPLPILYGGTGATTAAQARTSLGISGGTTTWYGTCGTTASTAAKVVTCANFALEKGAIIAILFTTANTAATPTLNVNSTGTKTIYVGNGTVNSTTNTLKWSANTLLYFMYDGTYYRYLGSQSAASVVPPEGAGTWYGTSSTAASTAAKTSAINNFKLCPGAIVNITFTYENTCVNSALTLNINSTGAKTIYVDGIATSTNNTLLWDAKDTLTFVYSGSYWYLVSRSTNIIEKNNLVVLKHPDIDIFEPPEEDIYGGDGALVLADAQRNQVGFFQLMHFADDTIWAQIGCNNRAFDDWNTISFGFDSNENPSINIAYPRNFCTALGLGQEATPVSGTSAISIAKSTNTNITSISPGSGKWIVFARCRWAATTAGNRTIKLSTVSGDTSTPINTTAIPYGSAAYMSISGCFELSSNDSVYLIAYHDNGSAVNVSNYEITAYRIG